MIRVRSREDEPVEQLVRRFKRMCEKEGLSRQIKRNSFYEKPSEKSRRSIKKAIKRRLKNEA